MATHDRGIVDTAQKRVVELRNGEIIRDQRSAGYQKNPTGKIDTNFVAFEGGAK
jgi:cell division transport system ATP-binding protein